MKSIFIVDDQEVNLLLIKTALEGIYKTYAVDSMEGMFKLAEKIIPDLILLDIMMPEIDGFSGFQMIKNDVRLQSIPVIFLTAKNDYTSIMRSFEMGAFDFIEKPFSIPILLKRIETHIEMNEMSKAIKDKDETLKKLTENIDKIFFNIAPSIKNKLIELLQEIETISKTCDENPNKECVTILNQKISDIISIIDEALVLNQPINNA